MKRLLIIPLFLFAAWGYSQKDQGQSLYNRTMYAEGFGIGLNYSLNYEWLIKASDYVYLNLSYGGSYYLDTSFGGAYYMPNNASYYLAPVRLHCLVGKRNLFLNFGFDFSYMHKWVRATSHGVTLRQINIYDYIFINEEIGVRYYVKRFFIKASVIPLIGGKNGLPFMAYFLPYYDYSWQKKKLLLWPAISIGYSFNAHFAE